MSLAYGVIDEVPSGAPYQPLQRRAFR